MTEQQINELIKQEGIDTNLVSDGYHTFGELYDHRVQLFIALCNELQHNELLLNQKSICWKSKKHSDGSVWEGWFIAGIHIAKGKQITYHLPIDKWDELEVTELDQAPEWDGHTPADVLERLKNL